ncbi:MAG TPA: alpha-galactosidase [Candidatus Dormibacteraeota bacterium]|nr:alpha-galactosidase [Candidatus Dormibacteraeota bacterium]
MPKVTFIGAGSAVFARQLMTDILAIDGLDSGTFALVDIDPTRLDLARRIAERLVELRGKHWKVEASTERRDVLAGTSYVVNSIEVAGLKNVRFDYDIPLRYGVDQCIGDTIGPGGIFKALRTGPAWLDIVNDVQRLAPDAVILNYTNPMSILTLAALRTVDLPVVGLCHSVQGTSRQVAGYLGIPYEEMDWDCAGINHNAWFTRLERDGKDLYPLLRDKARDPDVYEKDPVRFEVMLHLGAFVTESSGHFSEYVPYFRKRPDLVKKYARPGYLGESGFYANNWPRWRQENDESIEAMLGGNRKVPLERSFEYGADIIEAIESGKPATIYGNVLNRGSIDNLGEGCVEVECRVDRNGITAQHFGPLPEQLAALNRSHMAVHELVVEALLERSKQKAKYALMLDPLTAAACSLEEIDNLFEEMWTAERESLAAFEGARATA